MLARRVGLRVLSLGALLALGPGSDAAPAPEPLTLTLTDLTGEAAPAATVSPLPESDAAALLATLPPEPTAPAPLPPPRAAAPPATVSASLPPPVFTAADTVISPVLVSLRLPDGDVPQADGVTVRFSQPMIALGAAAPPPVTLSPSLSGDWRWIDPFTATFAPTKRLPMATEYTVRVATDMPSALGATLAEPVEWGFRTPPPTLRSHAPYEGVSGREPLIWAAFDQNVDRAALLQHVEVRANGSIVPVRLATPAEILEAKENDAPYTVAFRPLAPLPVDTEVTVTFPTGTPSAEGPRVTEAPQSFSFRTFGPFVVRESSCYGDPCSWGYRVRLSNPIDPASLADNVSIEPPPAHPPRIDAYNDQLSVTWEFLHDTRYTITLAPSLRDVFGQSLGAPVPFTFLSYPGPDPTNWVETDAGPLQVLEPTGAATWTLQASGTEPVDVSVWQVTPEDWPAWERWQANHSGNPPGVRRVHRVFDASSAPIDEQIDLRPALPQGYGHAIAVARAEKGGVVASWIQSTRLGTTTFTDRWRRTVWVDDLVTARPRAGVTLAPLGGEALGTTDATGVARIRRGRPRETLVARSGADSLIVPEEDVEPANPEYRWFVFDDRGWYRPGETARVKGWVRAAETDAQGDLSPAGFTRVSWRLRSWRFREPVTIAEGTAAVSAEGGFDVTLPLPETLDVGQAELEIQALGGRVSTTHPLRIVSFRTPQYTVDANVDHDQLLPGESANLSVDTTYFSGGPLPGAAVSWYVHAGAGRFTPPGHPAYTFTDSDGGIYLDTQIHGRTDTKGHHAARLDVGGIGARRPVEISASANVGDLDRQHERDAVSLLVHPADVYVGLRTETGHVGVPGRVGALVVDLAGGVVAGRPVEVVVYAPEEEEDEPHVRGLEIKRCTFVSGDTEVSCGFTPTRGGLHDVLARVTDTSGRVEELHDYLWVSAVAPKPVVLPSPYPRFTVQADRDTYAPGDVAHLTVSLPELPANGLLTVRHSGVVSTRPVSFTTSPAVVDVPIRDGDTPITYVQLNVHRPVTPDEAWAGWNESDTVYLKVPPVHRTLHVEIAPDASTVEPGSRTSVDVRVTDSDGRPVEGAEVALWVVDDAVLTVAGYTLGDPIEAMYPHRWDSTEDADSRRLMGSERSFGGGGSADGVGGLGVSGALRNDFSPLAAFFPALRTDADGRLTATLTLPDATTRWKVLAVAARGRRFGSGESAIATRLPLALRPSPPRLLRVGDVAELPLVVQNDTDSPVTVDLVARATGLTVDAAGHRVALPAHGRAEVRLPARAEVPGEASVTWTAAAGQWRDTVRVAIPVEVPASAETVAVYGAVDADPVAIPLALPTGADLRYGGLRVEASATQLGTLVDGLRYEVDYPYGCSEQRSSRILSIVTLKGVPGFDPEKLDRIVRGDIAALAAMQTWTGGFGFWSAHDTPWPYPSLYAGLAVVTARARGYAVPTALYDGVLDYARKIEKYLPDYGEDARASLRALALTVRARAGDADPAAARALLAERPVEKLPADAAAWLLTVLPGEPSLLRTLASRAELSASEAHIVTSYGDDEWVMLGSERRTDAIVLDALVRTAPDHPLVAGLARSLLARRAEGRWRSTQETAWALVGLGGYLRHFEGASPDFSGRAWVGDARILERRFRAATHAEVEVPLGTLPPTATLTLAKEGTGRLYYRVAMDSASTSTSLAAKDAGFVVDRSYGGAKPGDVRLDPDGTWHIRAGAEVYGSVSVFTRASRKHVAVVDALPAGIEPIGAVETEWERDYGARWDHTSVRDDRIEGFRAGFPAGVQSITWHGRATTPGSFVVPPARAEEMYAPETFGRSASDRVIIEE